MKAECSDEILAHDLSTISTGLHLPSEISTRKGMDATRDHETITDEDLYELHIWCHHDINSRPRKTHVTLFREKIRSPEDVHPSLLDRKNQPSQLGLSTDTDPGKLPLQTKVCEK